MNPFGRNKQCQRCSTTRPSSLSLRRLLFPPPRPDASRTACYRNCLEQHEAETGLRAGNWWQKSNPPSTWVDELVHHSKIVDAAEDVLGPEPSAAGPPIFSSRRRNSPGFASWHQDAFYRGLSRDDVMTAGWHCHRQPGKRRHEIRSRPADAGRHPACRHDPKENLPSVVRRLP